ncbi:MAG: DUF523 and DUF1722 domain-containing protein [Pseudomonadota bacterium]
MPTFLDYLPPPPKPPLRVAISECLVGGEVRHDGSSKKSSLPHKELEGLFDFQPVCPEVSIGMGVPREAIRLTGDVKNPQAVGTKSAHINVTRELREFANEYVPQLDEVDGYILMKNSPSCGLFRVKVYGEPATPPINEGRGIYAAEVVRQRPWLPFEENGRLTDPELRENFVTRAFVHAHWRALSGKGIEAKHLIAFHSAYKYLLMAHSVPSYQKLGKLLSNLSTNIEDIANTYFLELMRGLSSVASRGGHANVMSHLQGYVKNDMTSSARQELANLIESYRKGEVPLMAPLSLLKHHLGQHEAVYAWDQFYLNPHPPQAGLRRHL